ncbi:MAG: hypothetical protein ACYTFQ_21380 [Planctomycetota bacterium]|jgi:hypothetical protein
MTRIDYWLLILGAIGVLGLTVLLGSADAEMGPTLADRRHEVAKQKKTDKQELEFARRDARRFELRAKREEQENDAITVVRQSYLEQAVGILRNRQFHVKDDIASIRTEIATYTGEDLTVINAILDNLEDEADGILTSYPEGWPD